MQDTQHRTIDYLRVSVTDRCNFRCRYCMPHDGIALRDHREILRYEELLYLINLFSKQGLRNVRITGGEPLVRKGLAGFIRELHKLGTLDDLSMTTNGSLLGPAAAELKAAGLRRVNISLDTVDPLRFREITGGVGKLSEVLDGIEQALTVGLQPVKINAVLSEALREDDLLWFLKLASRRPVHIRFIEYMPIGAGAVNGGFSVAAVKQFLQREAGDWQQAELPGEGPARYYQLPGFAGTFGFIAALTEHFCADCNRLRLTADGKLKPCLLAEQEIDLAGPLRAGAADEELLKLLADAVALKPSGHLLAAGDARARSRGMSQIGG